MRYLQSITLSIILFACTMQTDREKIESLLIGNWTLDSLEFKDHQLFNPMSNIISFKERNEFEISGIEHCSWSVETIKQGQFYIILIATNPEFCDTLRLKFENDVSNKLLKIKLESERVEMNCSKLLLNYDLNRKQIENIVNLTKE